MQNQQSPKALKQRRFLLALPLLVIPFLTLAFWSLGGGKGRTDPSMQKKQGLNATLPDASLKEDGAADKLSFYDKAEADSEKLQKMIRDDPYYKKESTLLADTLPGSGYLRPELAPFSSNAYPAPPDGGSYSPPYIRKKYMDPNEAKIYRKLDQLNAAINAPAGNSLIKKENNTGHAEGQPVISSSDVDRLEGMMQAAGEKGGDDPEITQLNTMVDKILDIQHPERVRQKLRQASAEHKGQVYPVTLNNVKDNITLLGSSSPDTLRKTYGAGNGFYSLEQNIETVEVETSAIEAKVAQMQSLVSGAIVKLLLESDVYIGGILIPRGTAVFGTVSLSGERLLVSLSSIRHKSNLLPVALSAYDMDGLEGIYVPGAIAGAVVKEPSDKALQGIGISSLDPSLPAQAAGVGIQTAKNLLSKKVKLVKVTVKAGYKVLLKDNNSK